MSYGEGCSTMVCILCDAQLAFITLVAITLAALCCRCHLARQIASITTALSVALTTLTALALRTDLAALVAFGLRAATVAESLAHNLAIALALTLAATRILA